MGSYLFHFSCFFPNQPLKHKMTSSSAVLTSSRYGKDLVKVLRLVRSKTDPSSHTLVEYSIQVLLSASPGHTSSSPLDLSKSYTQADNSPVVATDSVKNTINYLTKVLDPSIVLVPELFSLHIAQHFLSLYPHLSNCDVEITQLKWSRIVLATEDGGEHKHSFLRNGDDKRIVSCKAGRFQGGGEREAKVLELKGGIKDLLVLKSTGSAFHGFFKDEFTTLKPVNDRIFSTAVECLCEYRGAGLDSRGLCLFTSRGLT